MKKNYLAGIIAFMILLLAAIPAVGEISARNTEENGKITETVWVDDSGNPAAGPEGYARVRYTYKREETIEKYFDADVELNQCQLTTQPLSTFWEKSTTTLGHQTLVLK